MTHLYPTGAVKTEKELLFGFLGQTMYMVHGLGYNSFLTEIHNMRNLRTEHKTRMFDYDNGFSGDTWKTQCCLGDVNIGSHHNHHYIFRNRVDADNYLSWAKTHTRNIRGSKYRLDNSSYL